jgi:hypothetical protein
MLTAAVNQSLLGGIVRAPKDRADGQGRKTGTANEPPREKVFNATKPGVVLTVRDNFSKPGGSGQAAGESDVAYIGSTGGRIEALTDRSCACSYLINRA